MNNFSPPDEGLPLGFDDEDDPEERERILHVLQQQHKKRFREFQRQLKRRMLEAAQASSDSEMDEITKGVEKGKMDVTPAGSTPPVELVKLDP